MTSFRFNLSTLLLRLILAAVALSAAITAHGQASLPRFDVFEFAVEGNSRLSDGEIERAVAPFLGESRTLADVEAARSALEQVYHAAGYSSVVVSIPEQSVDDGVVTLAVLEGAVERLRVKGAEYHLSSNIKARLPELAEGNVPYFPELQRQLDMVNRSADLKATPVLKAGRLPGSVDVTLNVDDSLPVHGSLELTNRATAFTEPLRLSASVRYDNLWQARHSVNLTAQTAPQAVEQVKVFAGTYVMPVGGGGDALAAYMVYSTSSVPSFPTGVLGNSRVFGLRYAMALRSTEAYSHSLSLGVDRKAVIQSLVLGGPGGVSTTTPPITYAPLVAAYNGTFLEKGGTTSIDMTANLGLRGSLGNHESEFAAKRVGASAGFLALRGGVRQVLSLNRWTFSGKLELQVASGPLVPNEQYAAGGAESVRGYRESERLGDDALRWTFEARTPSWQIGGETSQARMALIGFYEGARLRVREVVFPQAESYMLRGAGFGIRLSGPRGFSAELDIARAIDDAQVGRTGDHRLHTRLVWEY